MEMNDIQDKIDALERAIQEKEHELQLLKDDLETIRATVESAMQSTEEAAPVEEPTPEPIPEPAPEPNLGIVEDSTPAEPAEDTEAESEPQHEAIMRTIEAFSQEMGLPRKKDDSASVTLGDRAGQSKLSDLKKAFGINERFLFANELFNGDMSAFTQAVEELNHLESMGDAERLLSENLSQKYKWDEESETVLQFRSTVTRRFA